MLFLLDGAGEIYLLQCRRVASLFRKSDFEVVDNTAVRTDRELQFCASFA